MKTLGLRWIASTTFVCLGFATAVWWLTSRPVPTAAPDPAPGPGALSSAPSPPRPVEEQIAAAARPQSRPLAAGDVRSGALTQTQPTPRPSATTVPPEDIQGRAEESAGAVRPTGPAEVTGGSGLAPEAVTGPVLNTGAPLAAAVELSPWQSPAINVPPGERLPALFHDTRPLPAPQRQALDSIANDFIDAVGDPAGSTSDPAEVWEAARTEADRRYIILYGFQQYDQLHRAAALEGLSEKKALSRPNP